MPVPVRDTCTTGRPLFTSLAQGEVDAEGGG